jgi:hypothetical protein
VARWNHGETSDGLDLKAQRGLFTNGDLPHLQSWGKWLQTIGLYPMKQTQNWKLQPDISRPLLLNTIEYL